MICKCGYNFVQASLDALKAKKEQPYESFAVINDKAYKRFIKSEMKYYNTEDKVEKDKAFRKSLGLVGNMYICPECKRLRLLTPNGESEEFYKKD